jgi:Mg-chelatase subunit ChlI
MNPEEGELRPQLLDRFSLHISIQELLDEKQRVEIVKNNLWFGEAPLDFINNYQNQQYSLQQKILKARDSLNKITVSDQILEIIVNACIELNIDGHRPDIVTARSAKTLAAFEERREVSVDTLLQVAKMAIGFRTRRSGFEEPATADEVDDAFQNAISLFEPK